MTVIERDLRDFEQFVIQTVSDSDDELALEDYVCLWRARQERESTCEAIREGLDDLNAGRVRPAEEVIAAAVYQMQLRQAEGVDAANLQMVLAEADEDFAAGRVRQFEDEAELRAFAEEIKSRGRVRLANEKVCPESLRTGGASRSRLG